MISITQSSQFARTGDTAILKQGLDKIVVNVSSSLAIKNLEINAATGGSIRLHYNTNGTAENYADLVVGSSGELIVQPSSSTSNTNIKSNLVVDGTISGTNSEWDAAYTHSQVVAGNPHVIAATDLSDFTIANLADEDLLQYDTTSG